MRMYEHPQTCLKTNDVDVENEHLYKIGMFAQMNHVTVKTLRFYEEQGILMPAYVDVESGYRYYTMSQMEPLHRITALKEIGFSLEDIRVLNQGMDEREFMEKKQEDIMQKYEEITKQLSIIGGYMSTDLSVLHAPVLIKQIPAVTVASSKCRIHSYDALFELMPKIGKEMENLGCEWAYPEYCFTEYLETGYKEEDILVEICQSVTMKKEDTERIKFRDLPQMEAACIYHKGSYDSFSETYAVIFKYIEDNGYEVCGNIREKYIDGVWNKLTEDEWLSEIQIPVRKCEDSIVIEGLTQNNLKNVSLRIPKKKIVVFTGVSGSGKSSIVFDTIAAESQRQMNETYSAWIRGRLPKYEKPKVEFIDRLNPSVVIDQSRLGGNARSTVGTISDMYASLRLLFSRIGEPKIGPASYFSFNNPNGMCKTCAGIGKVMDLDITQTISKDKTYDEGMFNLPAFKPGNYYWKIYRRPDLFDVNTKWEDLSEREKNILLYGSETKDGPRIDKKIEGVYNQFKRLCLMKGPEEQTDNTLKKINQFMYEEVCPDCKGARLNAEAVSCKINGCSIVDMCEMEFSRLRDELVKIKDARAESIVASLVASLDRMIDIGLPYLSMNRESSTLSGGEAQRLKLVRYMGSSLTGMIYIFDEPSTGMHPRDVHRMSRLLRSLRDKGNTVLVVEHDKDIISIADEVIDVGPRAGRNGGQILFQGSYHALLESGTLTGEAMKEVIPFKQTPRVPTGFLPVRNANVHNLKNIDVDIPLGVLTVVTGVAGSGKSSLIRDVFAKQYEDQVVLVDQSAITATGRSTACTYLGFFDEIRKVFARENHVESALFSFNSKGACPACKGRGFITTELVFMEPVTTKCEACNGKRYSDEALNYTYKGKTIIDVLDMSVEEAAEFFLDCPKIKKHLDALLETGLPYLSLGQPLSTLSGGERQRVKLAKELRNKGNIYVLDEPTTGLHASDIKSIMALLDSLIVRGNTVVVIEHNVDVMKMADYIIDIGPDGGTAGGEVVFTGTPEEMVRTSNTVTARYLAK